MEGRIAPSRVISEDLSLMQSSKRTERVFVFRPDQPIETLGRDKALDGEEVIPGFTLSLDALFSSIDED